MITLRALRVFVVKSLFAFSAFFAVNYSFGQTNLPTITTRPLSVNTNTGEVLTQQPLHLYDPLEIHGPITTAGWATVAITNLAPASAGTYTNGATSLVYRIAATNLQGYLPLSTNCTIALGGNTNVSNAVTVTWSPIAGADGYSIERSLDAGVTWTTRVSVSRITATWTDYGSNTVTGYGSITNGLAALSDPTSPWGGTNDVAALQARASALEATDTVVQAAIAANAAGIVTNAAGITNEAAIRAAADAVHVAGISSNSAGITNEAALRAAADAAHADAAKIGAHLASNVTVDASAANFISFIGALSTNVQLALDSIADTISVIDAALTEAITNTAVNGVTGTVVNGIAELTIPVGGDAGTLVITNNGSGTQFAKWTGGTAAGTQTGAWASAVSVTSGVGFVYQDADTNLSLRGTYAARTDHLTEFSFTNASFIVDGAWHDLDLSPIVPAGATRVQSAVRWNCTNANSYVLLRRNGITNEFATIMINAQVAGVTLGTAYDVPCDDNRIIEYKIVVTTGAMTGFSLTPIGWQY